MQHAGGVPNLQTLAFNASDPESLWHATRNMNPSGPARNIIPAAADWYGGSSVQAFNEVREYHMRSRAPFILGPNDVPTLFIRGEQLVPVYANNPAYVRAVRLVALNDSAVYLPSELRRANIDPWNTYTLTNDYYHWVANTPDEVLSAPSNASVMRELSQHSREDVLWELNRDQWRREYVRLRR